ncbi:MAG TPA: hypothetical protein PLD54_02625 [Candidatus Levybacteria bacterium]|nr:hypothetical protein [Candidatus Levybacteria bacterium]
MKKLPLILCFFSLFISHFPAVVSAQTKTPAPSATPEASAEAELKTIEKIKEMVADKVSKLNLVEKRGFVGVVQDTSNTQITVQDIHGKKRFVDIDELTKFQDSIGSSKTFGISDITKGNRLAFVGNYNKDTERLLARFVTKTVSIPEYVQGTVTEVDDDEFTITVTTQKNEKKMVDVERSTTTKVYDSEEGVQKSGFSQIEVGEKILVVGFPNEDDTTRLSASRILHFIQTEESSSTTTEQE